MRILFNIIFSAILIVGLVGFWALFLNLWKPKKKWPAWVGYIIIIGAWFVAIRYYILNQVDLYGTMYYPLMNMFRTESYGFLFGVSARTAPAHPRRRPRAHRTSSSTGSRTRPRPSCTAARRSPSPAPSSRWASWPGARRSRRRRSRWPSGRPARLPGTRPA